MLKLLISFALALFTLTAQADSNSDECSGGYNGRISPWDFKLTNEDRNLQFLIYNLPAIPEIINLKCVKEFKDIIPKEDRTPEQMDFQAENIKEQWYETSNLIVNTEKYSNYLIILYCIALFYRLICSGFDSRNEDSIPENFLTSSMAHVALLSLNAPVFAGGILSAIQVALIYAVLMGAGVSNMEVRAILSAYQTGTVITSNVDIEKRVASNSEKNKGQIYSAAYEYEYNMSMIELAKLRSENITYDAFKIVPSNKINNTTTTIDNTTFTIANDFNGFTPANSGTDVSYSCGKVAPVVPDLSQADAAIQRIAKETDFVSSLKAVAATVTLENTEPLKQIWNDYKFKLVDNLEIKNIAEIDSKQAQIMKYFLAYLHAYANANAFYSNTVDGTEYSTSFKKLNDKRRDIAILMNSAICVSGALNAQENIMKIDRGISAQCGFFKDGQFGEILTQTGNSPETFENKAKSLVAQNMKEIQTARMKIEAIYEESRLELTNYSEFMKFSKCGAACMTNAFKMAERNNISDDLNSFRKSIDAVAKTDSQMYCLGSFEFENIKPQLTNELGATDRVISNVFSEFKPTESMNIDSATLVAGTVNSRVETEDKSILSFLDFANPIAYIRSGAGIPATANFTAEDFASCGTEGRASATCPIPRNGFFQTNENILDSFRSAGQKILMTGLIAKFAVQTLTTGADIVDGIKSKKGKAENVGSVSSDKSKSSNTNRAGKSSIAEKIFSLPQDALSAISDIIITIGGYIIMISLALRYFISLLPYITFMNIQISFYIAVVITIISVPLWSIVLLLTSNIRTVYMTYARLFVFYIVSQVLLVFFMFLIHQISNLFYVGLYLLISTSEVIQSAIALNEFCRIAINLILVLIFFSLGGYYYIKLIITIILAKYRKMIEIFDEKTKAGVDNTTDIIYAATLYVVQNFVRTVKNKETKDNSVKLSETTTEDLNKDKKN
ncbi:hypothetical protein HXW87_10965 [Pseudomonas sp. Y5-11]|jgi:hypothetical protein|uniref:hypothetical protein n=1 Tax=Pseudomonas sp. Y5-11 TaxID=2749808 RepID=UPI001EFB6A37|nr:hypothetical protein [Pseudomonas sp. Y5-11]ULN82673.1 hypothetical protein HXW87_10965 [Pseudomonas sp. Y5-11]